jgi:phospholipid/cholesterol/gamma-HCH transport system substrate-binding protein
MHKKALLGIILISIFFVVSVIYIGQKNLWFERKYYYWTVLNSGEGLQEGTLVTFNGLKVGSITNLDFTEDNQIKTSFSVRKTVAEKIRLGSEVKVVREMVIGEKKLEIVPGPPINDVIEKDGFIPGKDLIEISSLFSGDKFQELLPNLEETIKNVDILMKSLASNPHLGNDITATLQEATLTMRALQNSFILKGSVAKVKAAQKKKK